MNIPDGVQITFITLVVGSTSPTPTPCHHLSMQVSAVLLDIFSTYNCCNCK